MIHLTYNFVLRLVCLEHFQVRCCYLQVVSLLISFTVDELVHLIIKCVRKTKTIQVFSRGFSNVPRVSIAMPFYFRVWKSPSSGCSGVWVVRVVVWSGVSIAFDEVCAVVLHNKNSVQVLGFVHLLRKLDASILFNALTAVRALRALIDFTPSNARRFYSSMGNPLAETV